MRNRNNLYALLLLVCLPAFAANKKPINPPEFAQSPNFSQAILVGDTLYISGQVGQDLKMKDVPSDFEAEAKACFTDIGIILKAAGMTFDNVVSVQVYLTDMDLFAKMNAVYTTFFNAPRPSRTTVGVTKLANAKAHLEVTVTARK